MTPKAVPQSGRRFYLGLGGGYILRQAVVFQGLQVCLGFFQVGRCRRPRLAGIVQVDFRQGAGCRLFSLARAVQSQKIGLAGDAGVQALKRTRYPVLPRVTGPLNTALYHCNSLAVPQSQRGYLILICHGRPLCIFIP